MDDREQTLTNNPKQPLWAQFKPSLFSFREGLRFDFPSLA
jgi:hypothetical protein